MYSLKSNDDLKIIYGRLSSLLEKTLETAASIQRDIEKDVCYNCSISIEKTKKLIEQHHIIFAVQSQLQMINANFDLRANLKEHCHVIKGGKSSD